MNQPCATTAASSATTRCARRSPKRGLRTSNWSGCAARSPTCKTVISELRSGQRFTGTHHETFTMRAEQEEAVNKTHAYFHSIWQEDMHAVPRFLWNAKMRFGKTFTAYQLAKRARCQTRARRHLQARRRGCVADRPRIACRLRRVAVPLAQLGP